MTRRLQMAIEAARALPPDEQDAIAELILLAINEAAGDYQLTPEQVAEVDRIVTGLDDGTMEYASEAEVEAFWKSRGR